MEIINPKPKIFMGEGRVLIKKFNENKYKSLLRLLNCLGLKRNLGAEQRIRRYALEGYKKLILKKTTNKREFNKKIKEYKKERKKTELKEGIFEGNLNTFQFSYSPKAKFLAGGWKSKKFNKDEFLSLILSNMLSKP